MDARSILDRQVPVWDRAAASYHETFQDQTRQIIASLLRAVRAGVGTRLLDVATGPGFAAAEAAARGAHATGTDISAEMIREARRLHPTIDFDVADAAALPYADASFDAVTMNLGLFLIADPVQALAHIHRVLTPGGLFAHSLWDRGRPGHAVFYRAVIDNGGEGADLGEPPLLNVVDYEELTRVMSDAGFIDVAVESVPVIWRVEDAGVLYDAFLPMVEIEGLDDDRARSIRQSVRDNAEPYRTNHGYDIPFPALVVSGSKPAG